MVIIRQVEDKTTSCEVELMVWCDKMDLVALADSRGVISLHRLTWTKAWQLNPPIEKLKVTAIAWRQDGKLLSVCYNSGLLNIVKAENKSICYSVGLNAIVNCAVWVHEPSEINRPETFTKNYDVSGIYLPDPPYIAENATNYNLTKDHKSVNILLTQSELNILALGTSNGYIYLYIFGCVPFSVVNVNDMVGYSCSIQSVNFSYTLDHMIVSTINNTDGRGDVNIVQCDFFSNRSKEIYILGLKYTKITSIVHYIETTINSIVETWEGVMMELDRKLSKYASKLPRGGITADFLELLVFERCSAEMEEFLVHDLTKKGLEKLGQTIEISYCNIQKLFVKTINRYGQSITYHLSELQGMARHKDAFSMLGLNEESIARAIRANGSFMIKTGEMQTIINHSIIIYKSFFQWLYTNIMHLIDEPTPSNIAKMTNRDVNNIIEFVQNFDDIGQVSSTSLTNHKSNFMMERLGQYLQNTSLTVECSLCETNNLKGCNWYQFLEENHCIANHKDFYTHHKSKSLIQQFKQLKDEVNDVFKDIHVRGIHDSFKMISSVPLNFEMPSNASQTTFSLNIVLCGILNTPFQIMIVKVEIDSSKQIQLQYISLDFSHFRGNQAYTCVDFSFYSNTHITALIQGVNQTQTLLIQIPLSTILAEMKSFYTQSEGNSANVIYINAQDYISCSKELEGSMRGIKLAVSGNRRVSIVLGQSSKRVRLFEMEAEESDEDDYNDISNEVENDNPKFNNSMGVDTG